jgi:hypothetical protein
MLKGPHLIFLHMFYSTDINRFYTLPLLSCTRTNANVLEDGWGLPNNALMKWILAGKGKVVVWKSFWSILDEEFAQESRKETLEKLDVSVKLVFGRDWSISSDTDDNE